MCVVQHVCFHNVLHSATGALTRLHNNKSTKLSINLQNHDQKGIKLHYGRRRLQCFLHHDPFYGLKIRIPPASAASISEMYIS